MYVPVCAIATGSLVIITRRARAYRVFTSLLITRIMSAFVSSAGFRPMIDKNTRTNERVPTINQIDQTVFT